MSHLSFRTGLTLVASLALLGACGSDQKTANTPENLPPAEAPADTSTPPGAANPNGEPVGTPPASPPPEAGPQSRMDTTSNNTLAAPGSPSTQATMPALSENQVAMITELANTAEIEQAKLAQNKAKSASVKKFAATMIKHHGEAKAQQTKLYQSLKLTPTQSAASSQLKTDADQTLGSLRAADGSAFDTAYMESQVAEHQKVLDTIDGQLMPASNDQALTDELTKMRATVSAHLQDARDILSELQKKGSR
jgi:putative membrane protein